MIGYYRIRRVAKGTQYFKISLVLVFEMGWVGERD